MKKLLLFIVLLLPFWASAQIGGKKIEGPYTAKDGTVFRVGDTLRFGIGSRPDGTYTHILQPPNVLAGIPAQHLTPNFTYRGLPIKFLKLIKNKTGEFTVAIINPGGFNYVVYLESAIITNEILTASNSKKQTPTLSAQKTKAEQIKELKELLDAKAITQEEYDIEKGKILNQK